jgi:predicted nucleic acid-binding protein
VIVVDASVMVVALSSPSAPGDAARAAMTADDAWFAPAHMPLEVLRTLRRAVVGGHLGEDDAVAAFTGLLSSDITYVGADDPLLRAVWAMRQNVSAYDAAYLAVAAEYDAALVTFDGRLANAATQVMPELSVVLLDR